MKNKYPLIKFFDYDTEQVMIYDARRNMQFLFPKQDLPKLQEFMMNGKADGEMIGTLGLFQDRGLLLPGPMDRIEDPSEENIRSRISYFSQNIFMRKFVLEVTERCNFRCKYCFNSQIDNNRKHSARQMSLETAKLSIDYYKKLYTDFYLRLDDGHRKLLLEQFGPSIGFYGGEPTMNLSVVKESTEYFYSLNWNEFGIPKNRLSVTVNTNLSFVDLDFISFLTGHCITLFTSLDGPREYNDSNRIDANGRGTFDMSYSNLMKIKNADETYFKEKVSVLAVQTDDCDTKANREFLEGLGCTIQYLDQSPYGCFVHNPEKKIKELDEICNRWIEDKLAYIEVNKDSNIEKCLSSLDNLYFLDGILRDLPTSRYIDGTMLSCPMGFDNIMIGVNGDMHICHKTDGSMPFGNVRSGIDTAKIENLYRDFINASNCEECRSCWAFHFCPCCGATRMRNAAFVNPCKEECDYFRKQAELNFKLFIEVYKKYPYIITKLLEYKKDLEHYKSIVDYDEFMSRPVF